jgi:hypothetical protein
MTPVAFIEELLQASVTHWQVWGDAHRRPLPVLALSNREFATAGGVNRSNVHGCDLGRGGRVRPEISHKRIQGGLGAFDVDLNAF